jgi:ubiquinone/menaquinone biosynthesis C-methylase UbiE
MTYLVSGAYKNHTKILDLGIGSGRAEELIYKKIPSAEIVGIDSSNTMIRIAEKRLVNKNLVTLEHDLEKINTLVLPEGDYSIAITLFTLHEISAVQKREIFKFIYKTLLPGGLYVLVDRFKIDTNKIFGPYKSQWNWQSENANTNHWSDWKESFEEYQKRINSKDDSPDSVEDQLNWLRELGFKAACLQMQFDRGLIVGAK